MDRVVIESESVPEFVPPQNYTVFRGIELSGAVEDFADSDDVKATFNPGFTLNTTEAPIWLEFFARASEATSFRIESSAGTPGLVYEVEAWNWNSSAYDVIGSKDESFATDAVTDYQIVAADHIDGNGNVRSRIGWRRIGFVVNFPWTVNVDQAGWTPQ